MGRQRACLEEGAPRGFFQKRRAALAGDTVLRAVSWRAGIDSHLQRVC